MDNITDKPMPANNLYDWQISRDPLIHRHGLSRVQYATPMQRLQRARRALSDRAVDIITAFVLGVTFAVLFFCGWSA